MRLLVYEHVSGGGYADKALPTSVLSEGFGMLRTLAADFEAAGHHVSVMLDSRIASLNPPLAADCIVPVVSSLEVQANIRVLSEQVDAVYVVAPETDGVLKSLVERVEQTGAASLNCKAIGIEKTSDKASFTEFMRTFGFRMPETQLFSVTDDLDEITRTVRDLSFPLIFKPSES